MSDKLLAMYIRLSLEDGDLRTSTDKLESNSVSNQRKLLLDYYNSHPYLREYDIVEFCDDGYSGTNFERPNFKRMMGLVRQGEMQCILVKDLSRFGREYLEVGAYLELILPLFGTRFISANDAFDSNDYVGTTGGMELALRNLINGMYSKDLSVKVRSAIKTRNRRGKYWGGQTFYGYKLHPKDKHKLIVDEAVCHNIEIIFDMCISGMSTMQIAKKLNALGIPSPAVYKKQNGGIYNGRVMDDETLWIGGTVRHILNDERYTGKMVTGTRESVGIRSNKMRSLPREKWIVVEGTHEAIITPEIFQQAGEALRSRIRTVNDNTAGNRAHNLFVCGYCGRKLQKSHGKQIHLFCMRARSGDSPDCESLHEDMDILKSNALEVVKLHARLLLQKADYIEKANNPHLEQLRRDIRTAELRLDRIAGTKSMLYEEYKAGKYTKEAFKRIQLENKTESDRLERNIEALKLEIEEWETQHRIVCQSTKNAEGIVALSEYRPEVICRLVERIRVFNGGRMEIALKNADSFENMLVLLDRRPEQAC